MIYLGSCIAPVGQTRYGDKVMDYKIDFGDGREESGTLLYGEIKLYSDFPVGAEAVVESHPTRRFDVGSGTGRVVKRTVRGGVVGLVLDGRGRPLGLNLDHDTRREQLLKWGTEMQSYTHVAAV
jgi:hypothetical protein